MRLTISSVCSICSFLVFTVQCLGQTFGPSYFHHIQKADTLYKNKQFLQAALNYDTAFAKNEGVGYIPDRMMAARAWSMVSHPDSAFFHLFRIIERVQYDEPEQVEVDSAFTNLHEDPRWKSAISLMKTNKQNREAKLNRQLIASLDTIFNNDQMYRIMVHDTIHKYGMDSRQVDKLNKMIMARDSRNTIKVTEILETYGWPNEDIIGPQHGNTLFSVIQHADLHIQQKYLPLMREAVKTGAAEKSSLALLEDRVAVSQGQCQQYGSQLAFSKRLNKYYVLPLSDPANVDQRRDKMDLPPLSEYVAIWDIKWDAYAYTTELRKVMRKRILKKYACLRN